MNFYPTSFSLYTHDHKEKTQNLKTKIKLYNSTISQDTLKFQRTDIFRMLIKPVLKIRHILRNTEMFLNEFLINRSD